MMSVQPITLQGRWARLVPLELAHAADLLAAGSDPQIWQYLPYNPSVSAELMRAWIESAHRSQAEGADLPFAIIEVASGRAVGSTRYMDIRPGHHGLEIGSTWLGRPYQRTALNTECKYMLLRHAFETLGAIRVQLKTDMRNLRSQRAIERLGAVREGLLRNHMIMPDGYHRSTVMYSIVDTEWPHVKANLEGRLESAPA